MDIGLIGLALAAAVAAAACAWWVLRAHARAAIGAQGRAWIAGGLAVGLAAVGAAYAWLGEPGRAGLPAAARLADLRARAATTDFFAFTPDEQLALMADRAKQAPTDPRPHLVRGLVLADLRDDEGAAQAFEAALRRDPDNAVALVELGRVLTRLQAGAPSARSLAVFQAAAARDPANPIPWFYLALGASQEARWAEAARLWPEVQARLPADDPRQTMARQMLAQAQTAQAGAPPTEK